MLKIHFHTGAKTNSAKHCFGYGRVYHSLLRFVPRVAEVKFVENYKEADIQVCMIMPEMSVKYYHWWGRKQHPVQVFYTPWDAEKIPPSWFEVLFEHTNAKAIFTTSRWCVSTFANAFRKYGKKLPIYLAQHGVNVEAFPYFERDWSGDLVYLWQGQNLMDRKRGALVREAFMDLQLQNAHLVEKWYPIDSAPWGPYEYTEQKRLEVGQFLNGQSYHDLLKMSHVSVNPSRAEGFGLLPLETACTGMATAATNWSGFTDYLNDECFWPLAYELSAEGEDYFNTSLFNSDLKVPPCQDALVSKEEVQRFMLWCYENREAAKEMGKRAHEYVKKNWTWDRSALQFLDALHDVAEQHPMKKSWRTRLLDILYSLRDRHVS